MNSAHRKARTVAAALSVALGLWLMLGNAATAGAADLVDTVTDLAASASVDDEIASTDETLDDVGETVDDAEDAVEDTIDETLDEVDEIVDPLLEKSDDPTGLVTDTLDDVLGSDDTEGGGGPGTTGGSNDGSGSGGGGGGGDRSTTENSSDTSTNSTRDGDGDPDEFADAGATSYVKSVGRGMEATAGRLMTLAGPLAPPLLLGALAIAMLISFFGQGRSVTNTEAPHRERIHRL